MCLHIDYVNIICYNIDVWRRFMKNINKMSYDEFHKEFGIILNVKYMRDIIHDQGIYDEFTQLMRLSGNDDERKWRVEKFVKDNFKYVDREAYAFFTLKTLLEEGLLSKTGRFPTIMDNCKQALEHSDYAYFEPNNRVTMVNDEIKRVTAAELIGKDKTDKKSKNEQRIEELSEKINLHSLFTLHSTTEMKRFYGKNDSLNDIIVKLGLIDAVAELYDLSIQERMELLKENSGTKLEGLVNNKRKELENMDLGVFYQRLPSMLEKYPDCFELDPLFLIAAYRANEYLETAKLSPEQNKDFAELMKILEESIRARSTSVSGIISNNGGSKQNYSFRELRKACARICSNGHYVSTNEEEKILDELSSDPKSILSMDPEIFQKIITLSPEDIMELGNTEGVFDYLVRNKLASRYSVMSLIKNGLVNSADVRTLIDDNLLDKGLVTDFIEQCNVIDEELLGSLRKNGIVSDEEMVEYYLAGKMELDAFSEMDDEEKKKLEGVVSPEKLISLYKNADDEYGRYAALYRMVFLSRKDKDSRYLEGERIIEASDGEFEDSDLVKWYEEHLISLKSIEEWAGNPLIMKMMRDGKLKPADVKEICTDGNYDCVLDILKDPRISKNTKWGIFYTTFADEDETLTEEQKELREVAKEEGLEAMRLTYKNVKVGGTSGRRRVSDVKEGKDVSSRREYVSDPLNRWTLIKLLDPEYSYEMLDQGMMIFKLPNVGNGTIILEKMFKKDRPDYARATKMLSMPIEEFEDIKDDLIIDGDIPVAAIANYPKLQGRLESFWHTKGWGEKLSEACGYKEDTRRTKDEIDRIDLEIKKIVNSRKLRG